VRIIKERRFPWLSGDGEGPGSAQLSLERLPVERRSFQGSDPRGRPDTLAAAAGDPLDQYWRQAKSYNRRAVVAATEMLTATGTLRLTLRAVDGDALDFSPGQFIGIEAAGDGVRRRRTPYCVLSPPGDGDTFQLLVRVVPQGPLSRHLGELRVGDSVGFRGPTGRSMIPREDGTSLVLLATGVGVSPFYSLARHLLERGAERRIRLLWGLRHEADVCLVAELDELANAYPNFSYQISLSQPGPTWDGLHGRLTDSAPRVLGDLDGKHFYLCGNGEMTGEFATALSELGVSGKLIYEEAFFNARCRPDPVVLSRLRDRLAGGADLSPVVSGEKILFPLERPLGGVGARRPL
jgi:ferredoxin-NADP reductase